MTEKVIVNEFDSEEFNELCRLYGHGMTHSNKADKYKSATDVSAPFIRDVKIGYDRAGFFEKIKKSVEHDRRGEAVFCVIKNCATGNDNDEINRMKKQVILITCSEYPPGIFRIPSGGVGYGENPSLAALREVKEELGLTAVIRDFAGVIRIKFILKDDWFMFYSYLFVLDETGGRLLIDATDDEISEIRLASIDEIAEAAEALGNISGTWRDWGRFRQVTTRAVYGIMRQYAYPKGSDYSQSI